MRQTEGHVPGWLKYLALASIVLLLVPITASGYLGEKGLLEPQLNSLLSASCRTLKLCLVSAMMATILGAVIASRISRAKSDILRTIILTGFLIPLFLPQYILSLSWSLLLGGSGVIAQAIGSSPLAEILQHETGREALVAVVFIVSTIPITIVAGLVLLSYKNSAEVEAAQLHLSATDRFFLAVRRDGPSWSAITLLITIYLASDFAAADLFQVRLVATEIFAIASQNVSHAFTVFIPVTVFCLLLVAVLWMRNEQSIEIKSSRNLNRILVQNNAAHSLTNSVQKIIALLAFIAMFLPIVNLITVTGDSDNFKQVGQSLKSSIFGSLYLSVSVSVLATLLGGIMAFYIRFSRGLVASISRLAVWILMLVPSSLLALAYLSGMHPLTHSWPNNWVIAVTVFALTAKWLVISMEIIHLALSKYPMAAYESGLVLTSGWLENLMKLILPNLAKSLLYAFVVIALLVLNDLAVTIMTLPPGWSTLSTHLYSYVHYGPEAHIAAVSSIHVAIISVPALFCSWRIACMTRLERECVNVAS